MIKLLKKDIKEFKSNCGGHLSVGSFHVKMLLLKLMDEKPDNEYWSRENLRFCYIWVLGRFIRCLRDEYVSHYFVKDINIIQKITWKSKYDGLVSYLEHQKDIYSE